MLHDSGRGEQGIAVEHILTDNISAMTASYASNLVNIAFTTKLADNLTTTTTLAVYK